MCGVGNDWNLPSCIAFIRSRLLNSVSTWKLFENVICIWTDVNLGQDVRATLTGEFLLNLGPLFKSITWTNFRRFEVIKHNCFAVWLYKYVWELSGHFQFKTNHIQVHVCNNSSVSQLKINLCFSTNYQINAADNLKHCIQPAIPLIWCKAACAGGSTRPKPSHLTL